MPQRLRNPFQAQTPIGASIAQLGEAIFGNIPKPGEREKQALETQFFRSKIDNLDAKTRQFDIQDATRAGITQALERVQLNSVPTVAPRLEPGASGPARQGDASRQSELLNFNQAENERTTALENALQKAHRLGIRLSDSPQDVNQGMRGLLAITPGVSDELLGRSVVGSGQLIGENQAVSLPDRERLRAANLEADIAQDAAKPRTLSQVQGETFRGLDPAIQDIAVGPNAAKVRGGAALDLFAAERGGDPVTDAQRTFALGSQAFGAPLEKVADPGSSTGITLTPRPEAAGQPGVAPASSNRTDITGVPAATRNKVLQSNSDIDVARNMTKALRQLSDPSFFGSAGFLKQTIQNAKQQGSALAGQLDETGANMQAKVLSDNLALEGAGEEGLDPALFDQNLPMFQFIRNLLVYRLALINNPDGRISTPDFNNANNTLGGQIGVFSFDNQKQFLANLDAFDRFMNITQKSNDRLLRGDFGGSAEVRSGLPEGGLQPGADELSDEALLQALGITQ